MDLQKLKQAREKIRTQVESLNHDFFDVCRNEKIRKDEGPEESLWIDHRFITEGDYKYFSEELTEQGFKDLIRYAYPYKTWFVPAPIDRHSFNNGVREFRTFKPKVTIKPSLEYRYWSAVLESISTCPEFVPSIFGLENWMVQDILCGSYSIEEVWYSLKCYMNFSTYLFRLRNVNNRANVAGCLDVLKIYFRLCSSYFDPKHVFATFQG